MSHWLFEIYLIYICICICICVFGLGREVWYKRRGRRRGDKRGTEEKRDEQKAGRESEQFLACFSRSEYKWYLELIGWEEKEETGGRKEEKDTNRGGKEEKITTRDNGEDMMTSTPSEMLLQVMNESVMLFDIWIFWFALLKITKRTGWSWSSN